MFPETTESKQLGLLSELPAHMSHLGKDDGEDCVWTAAEVIHAGAGDSAGGIPKRDEALHITLTEHHMFW